ncbi:Crp/Fnr family transcriptional regulator [Christensenellaceae bacterium OttesenSCG-928-K19]|nr:Crp/Fnr family transcriptional regulator [Christensenellaceae bacterium OttesenSCG-928-K19]
MDSKQQKTALLVRLKEFTESPPAFLADKVELVRLKTGEFLLEQGAPIDCVYLLCKGKIGIYNISLDGATSRVVFISTGETIGEMEILCGREDVAFSARVYEDSELFRIYKDDFIAWLKEDTGFMFNVTTILANKLYDTASAICQHVGNDAIGLVSLYIIEAAKSQLEQKEVAVIRQTRAEIAENCRISERTVNRSIKYLSELGLVGLVRGKISINHVQMQQLSQSGFMT